MVRFAKLLSTDESRSTVLIRLMVGMVFLSEGIQKFLFPAKVGVGRFEKIGFPFSEVLAPVVASFEILCGSLVLIGLATRAATVPLIVIMLVALTTTKSVILFDNGFWEMMHASRTDWAMLLGSLFLFIRGGGRWSIDKKLSR